MRWLFLQLIVFAAIAAIVALSLSMRDGEIARSGLISPVSQLLEDDWISDPTDGCECLYYHGG